MSSTTVTKKYWSMKEVAVHYGLSVETIRKWVSQARFPYQKISRRILIDPFDFEKHMMVNIPRA